MSLELALEKLADAINNHAAALREAAGASVKVDTSMTRLAESAKSEVAKVDVVKDDSATKTNAKADVKDNPDRKVYWTNAEDNTYGECTIAEYRKMSKGSEAYSLIDPSEYKDRVEAGKKLMKENKAAAEKARKAKEAAEAKAAAEAAEVEAAEVEESDEITDEQLAALVKPFAGVDTPAERKRRVEWLKTLFSRLGVAKASELPQDTRGEFVAIVKQAIEAVEDDEGADLPDLDGDMSGLV